MPQIPHVPFFGFEHVRVHRTGPGHIRQLGSRRCREQQRDEKNYEGAGVHRDYRKFSKGWGCTHLARAEEGGAVSTAPPSGRAGSNR